MINNVSVDGESNSPRKKKSPKKIRRTSTVQEEPDSQRQKKAPPHLQMNKIFLQDVNEEIDQLADDILELEAEDSDLSQDGLVISNKID